MSPRIAIAGGGLAGLAACVALTERGFSCTLLESRTRLGGRASSFHDPTTNTEIDNCQHITLGCCTNFRHFCQITGLAEYFHRESTLYFLGADGKTNRFSTASLPAPLHLLPSLLKLSYLSWYDKFMLARGLRTLAGPISDQDEARPFSEWLQQHGQTPAAINRFWIVVLVSALSESLDRISTRHARKVFVDTFLRHRDGWFVDIPTVPLEILYGGRLTEWLTSRGTTIRLQSPIEAIEMTGDRVDGFRLSSTETIQADHYVIALPFYRLESVLPESVAEHASLSGIRKLDSAPISSIHLWFDRPITELRHAVLVDRLCQWIFNRTAIGTATHTSFDSDQQKQELGKSWYYQIVISASHALAGRGKDEILNHVLGELTSIWPQTAQARLLHSRQVTEHRAVFSPVPGVDSLRPVQQSAITNLQFAGDWTRTDWPATMEGAVRSGYLAAENILRQLGSHESVLQPDLPTMPLSRVLFGL